MPSCEASLLISVIGLGKPKYCDCHGQDLRPGTTIETLHSGGRLTAEITPGPWDTRVMWAHQASRLGNTKMLRRGPRLRIYHEYALRTGQKSFAQSFGCHLNSKVLEVQDCVHRSPWHSWNFETAAVVINPLSVLGRGRELEKRKLIASSSG